MRVSSRDAHAVRCDWKPTTKDYDGPGFCDAVFRSYGMLTALRGQLEAGGWTVVPGSRYRETEHFCPKHRPRPQTVVTSPREWAHDSNDSND